jgi:hypothetical protein
VVAGESLLIVIAVYANVELMFGSKLGHHVVDVFHTEISFSHCFGGEVGVAA